MLSKTTQRKTAPKKVLIVEDEGEMCLLLNIILDSKDLELDHVPNLGLAAEYLDEQQPSVLILDNRLPDGYGVDYISKIKSKYPGLGIIMISGYDGSVQDVALQNGADIFLKKPFSGELMYQSIRKLTN